MKLFKELYINNLKRVRKVGDSFTMKFPDGKNLRFSYKVKMEESYDLNEPDCFYEALTLRIEEDGVVLHDQTLPYKEGELVSMGYMLLYGYLYHQEYEVKNIWSI